MPRTLQARLDDMREASAKKIPPEARAVMHRATAALADSGQADRALGLGKPLPAFALPDSTGATVSSSELLSRGPLILTFFRGRW